MKTTFFYPHWGSDALDASEFVSKVVDAGYDGVEISLGPEGGRAAEVVKECTKRDLPLILQETQSEGWDFETYQSNFKENITRLTALQPLLLNSHTGRDYFSFEQNASLIEFCSEMSDKTGVPIAHETHRGRFPFSALKTSAYLERFPAMKLVADFSHWCCVSESLLEGQEESLTRAMEHTIHIHGRVGYAEGPQVSDPAHPRWQRELARHMAWWDRVRASRKSRGSPFLTLTTEFGPEPYLPVDLDGTAPSDRQWKHNVFLKTQLLKRWGE